MNSKDRREYIAQVTNEISGIREIVRKGHEDGTLTVKQDAEATERVTMLNARLHAAICDGAAPCPNCGTEDGKSTVRGLRHEMAGKKGSGAVLYSYEVGCVNAECKDHRATDLLPELAVERWNAGDYDPPRSAEPAAVPSEG